MMLHKQGYGVAKGIPTSMIAASSFDDIIAITAFGVFKTIAFNDAPGGATTDATEGKTTIAWEIGNNLVQLATGLGVGLGLGFSFILFQRINNPKVKKIVKIIALMIVAIAMPIVAEKTKFAEAKFVGIIFFGYACFRVWGEDKPDDELGDIWMFC